MVILCTGAVFCSFAATNATATGTIDISDTTVVNGEITEVVAIVDYGSTSFYGFATLQDAIDKAAEDSAKGIACSVRMLKRYVVAEGESVTLDLKGQSVTTYAVNSNYDIVVKGDLTITGEGELIVKGYYGIGVTGTGSLTVESGKFTHDSADDYYLIGNFGGTVVIEGGELYSDYCAVNNFDQGENTGSVSISGGVFGADENGAYYDGLILGVNTTITGGTFNAAIVEAEYTEMSISGGAFSAAVPEAYCAIGYKPTAEANAEGYYTVEFVTGTVAADEEGNLYSSVQDAINAVCANGGGTVKLLTADSSAIVEDSVIVKPGVTLDLGGQTLACDYLVGFNGGQIADSVGGGKVLCARKGMMLSADNEALPVWNGVDGYIFENVTQIFEESTTANGSFKHTFLPRFETIEAMLQNGGEAYGLSIQVTLSWDEDGMRGSKVMTYTDEMVKTVYGERKAFTITLGDYEDYTDKNLTLQVAVVSELGVAYESGVITVG